jgi:hypothetical protein
MAGKQFRTSLGVALAVVAVLSTACGGGGGGTTSGATGSQQTGPTGSTVATSPPTVTGVTGVTGATTAAPQGAKLSGTWSGTWKDTSPDTAEGTFKLTWQQSGPTLNGTITIAGTPCLSGGHIAGALNGSTISFGVVKGAVEVAYTGSVSGTTMSGTYTTSCGNAQGNWEARRTG